ncbi:MAG: metallophosphoesterase [Candidatus Eremiobacterota bacterium]
MQISNQMGPVSNLKASGTKQVAAKEGGIDLNALSAFMDKDAVSIGQNDTDIPEKHWHFQLAEPTVGGVMKAAGVKGGGSPVTIGIIHTNDEHDPKFEKFAGEAAVIKKREKVYGDENSIIVNTGDVTYESFNDKPGPQFWGPVPEIFNKVGMEFVVPGNHEFQHGGKYLEDNLLPKLDAQTLLANITYKSSGKALEHTKPFVIQDINGVKVGIIGLCTPKMATKAHPKVGYDVRVDSIQSAAAKVVPEAKKAGAEVIVIIAHEGINRCVDAASSVPGIDVIVAGHDHQELQDPKEVNNPDGRKTIVVEAASHGKYVGDVSLEVDPHSKQVVGVDYKLFPVSKGEKDPDIQDIVNKYLGGR